MAGFLLLPTVGPEFEEEEGERKGGAGYPSLHVCVRHTPAAQLTVCAHDTIQ